MNESYSFSQVPVADIQRSQFNRTHTHKTTFDAGYLIPIYVDEALPGDTFNLRASMFTRMLSPLTYPVMDNMYMDIFFFAVPNRLLWNNWQKFMGEREDPDDSTDFLIPQTEPASADGFEPGSIFDYFGIPVTADSAVPPFTPQLTCNALFARAYNLIWNEWFRDQNIQDSAVVDKDNGPDVDTDYPLRKRGKRHDYFTSCLPWPQKGPGVTLPLGTSAPINPTTDANRPQFINTANSSTGILRARDVGGGVSNVEFTGTASGAGDPLAWRGPNGAQLVGLVADLTNASAATINSLRQAFQIQKLLERDARGGTRYVELLRSHFGVVSPDARLQRPEFLGGGSVNITVNPVTQTSSTEATSTPQANLSAFVVGGGHGIGFAKSFVEHSVIIGLACVRADLTYQQGIHRMFTRRTRYDFYWPALAHLGEQAVLTKEINAYNQADRETVFGYQERWAEYRYFPSKITGLFRGNIVGSLQAYHLAQAFADDGPSLSEDFIEENPPVDRIIAVTGQPMSQFLMDAHFQVLTARPMPMYSVPGFTDHF